MLAAYLKSLFDLGKRGDAREETFYPALAGLLRAYAADVGRAAIHITILPKKTEGGNPDMRVWDGTARIAGYVEAKAPSAHLDDTESSPQFKRYLAVFPNIILTNYYEFRLYRNGTLTTAVQVARPFAVKTLKMVPPVEHEAEFANVLAQFFSFSFPAIKDAGALAKALALRTRFLTGVVADDLAVEAAAGKGSMLGFFNAFREYLIHDLAPAEFADLYAQTVAYGMFAARTRARNGFSRRQAFEYIPATIGILRDLFRFISLGDLSPRMAWIVDDIAEALAATDVKAILRQYYTEHKGADPIIHFYETFLAAYDPKTRERRGVYYTPDPVVGCIERSIHGILQRNFKLAGGLANTSVTVLDFAGGTQAFNASAARIAVEQFVTDHGEGGRNQFIREHILEHFLAFELMMAPYAIGHIKMGFLLEELGCALGTHERFKFYLTNTLELAELKESSLPGLSALSEESHMATRVKRETPVLVIHGNPPYSGVSANMNEWIVNLIKNDVDGLQSFYTVDGEPLGEKKLWLQDDYVKFIRFAQWKIQQRGEGIVGIVTNHAYLDNPTFRGMRQSLMRTFDEIYVLDLHGNTKRKERSPDGGKDENVFDIQQGVAIALLVKHGHTRKECTAAAETHTTVYHADLWGSREHKYEWLRNHDVGNIRWKQLKPTPPYRFFVRRDETGRRHYGKFWKLTDIFPVNVTGIVTARDSFVVDIDLETLKRRIEMFRDVSLPDELIRETFKLKDTRGWKLPDARRALRDDQSWRDHFRKILYRPFDVRDIYYTSTMVDWGRLEIMGGMCEGNLAIATTRSIEIGRGWEHVFCTDTMIQHHSVSIKEVNYLFPLYLRRQKIPKSGSRSAFTQLLMLFDAQQAYDAQPDVVANMSQELLRQLAEHYGKDIAPRDVFNYIYAVMFAPSYRTTHAEQLKVDFPRVPMCKDSRLFDVLAKCGEELVNLHLLTSEHFRRTRQRFCGKGDSRMVEVCYDEREEKVYINPGQYFEHVAPEVWNYHVGGYQVCEKWLKDRKGRVLALDDILHYIRIAHALARTIEIQRAIDAVYDNIEKDVIEA